MSTADDLRAISTKAASELEAQADLIQTQNETILQLQADLKACQDASAPKRVPMGLYSGELGELQSREQQLGQQNLPAWVFRTMNSTVPAGWDTGRIVLANIHARVSGSHKTWKEITSSTTYDAGIIALLKSLKMTTSTVMLSVQEEHDGKDGILGNQSGGTFYHGTAAEYRAFFNKVRTLAKTHCPDVKCGQIVADADRLASCLVPDADFYGSDPHFYGWTSDGKPTGGTFAQRLQTLATRLEQAGVGDKPFIINVGGVERAGDPTAKAGYISDMADVLKTARTGYPNLLYATWWDRGTEAVDTSPQSLEAFRKCFA